jgi:hypothetical protein
LELIGLEKGFGESRVYARGREQVGVQVLYAMQRGLADNQFSNKDHVQVWILSLCLWASSVPEFKGITRIRRI